MKARVLAVAAMMSLLSFVGSAFSQAQLVDSYCATPSENDHHASDGLRLRDAAAQGGSGSGAPGADEYPFVGKWDCEVATFIFTPTVYNNGSEDLPILEIQEGSDGSYTLFFENGYLITLSGFTRDAMGWYSHASGDSFNCRRLD